MKYPFTCKVNYCFNTDVGVYEVKTENVFGFCSNFENAAAQIEALYSEDLVSIDELKLYEGTDSNCIIVSNEVFELLKEQL